MTSIRDVIKKQDDYDSMLYQGRQVKCSCSHTITFGLNDRKICGYCGKWVYRTPEAEFFYKTTKAIIDKNKCERGKKNDKNNDSE